jgi:deazaflavin-dependent oxidoreductase (nitroreductase family)
MSSKSDPTMADDLAAWGKVIMLETVGRVSGRARSVTIGFVEEPNGSLLVAAASETTNWARNLVATTDCTVERDGVRHGFQAVPLDRAMHAATVTALILKYGTPAEGLGAGPAFRLQPVP